MTNANTNIVGGRPSPGDVVGGPPPVTADGAGVCVFRCEAPSDGDEENGRYSRSFQFRLDPRKGEESFQLREFITGARLSAFARYELDLNGEFLSLVVPTFGLDGDDIGDRLVRVVGGGRAESIMANPTGKRTASIAEPDSAPDPRLQYNGYALRDRAKNLFTLLLVMERTATCEELAHAAERVIAELATRGIQAKPGPAKGIRLPRNVADRLRFNGSRRLPIEPPSE